MKTLRSLFQRLRNLLYKEQLDRDFGDELTTHQGKQAGCAESIQTKAGVFRTGTTRFARQKRSEEQVQNEGLHVRKNLTKNQQANEQACHAVIVATDPVQITLRAVLGHQQHDGGAAVERRNGQKIERAKKQIQHERDFENEQEKTGRTGHGVAVKKMENTAGMNA